MLQFSTERLRDLAREALRRCHGAYHCDTVSNEFLVILETYDGVKELPSARRAPFNGANHFVATVPTEIVENYEERNWVVVDPTIRQFEDKIEDSQLLDGEVAVLPPSDPRRKDWYDSVSGI